MKLPLRTIAWVGVFALTFALVEAAVVVYLRGLYYPGGFVFPLRIMQQSHIVVELAREVSTIVMLVAVGALAGVSRWQQFSYFMIAFGVWDIFYYLWLKLFLDWPSSLADWDILFLIPIPWIGPVAAPVMISVLMIVAGIAILRREAARVPISPSRLSWILGSLGTAVTLFTFLRDTEATLKGGIPEPYSYWLFGTGILLYLGALSTSFRDSQGQKAE